MAGSLIVPDEVRVLRADSDRQRLHPLRLHRCVAAGLVGIPHCGPISCE